MADVAVNFAVQLLHVALGEIKLLRGVRGDMEWLHRELQRMRCFLLDAERRSSSGDEVVKNWVQEITDAAYEAEDIASKFAPRKGLGFRATLRRYAFRLKELGDIGNDIKKLKEKLVEIGESRERYGISSSSCNVGGGSNNLIHELRRRPIYQSEEHVIGLENDKGRVMELLHAKERRCYVIGIVGMGGMGKTTLARQVFKSINRREFPKTAWLDLCRNYIRNHHNPVHKLLTEIAKQVMSYSPKSECERTEELSELVKRRLMDGRYLIVMDDMWEAGVWDLIKDHLPDTGNGSRIIITTRKENVAEYPAFHFPFHHMTGLDDLRSWYLFTHLVFEDEEQIKRECTDLLKKLAEELICGCGGSPLALTVLGGLLAGKEKTCSAWRDVLGDIKWLRREAGKNCLEILKLSYMDLPHYLKRCFLYLSAFPEDHDIHVEKLIRLWIAEGFVLKTNSTDKKTIEEIARTYIYNLRERYLVRVHEKFLLHPWERYSHEYCRIHDLVREMSINEAKEVNFMNSEITNGSNRAVHRFSLQEKFPASMMLDVDGINMPLRTLLNFIRAEPMDFKNIGLLRVLDLEGAEIRELPKEVGDMILLRYLSIKGTMCMSLPCSISRLSYLETLDCRASHGFRMPDDVWKMKALKHVYGRSLFCPVDISNLVKLQTLVYARAPFVLDSMQHMANLQDLSIYSCFMTSNLVQMDIWKVLQSLPWLKSLNLCEFRLPNIVTNKSGFPSLQRLTMSMCHISSWEVEEGSIPSLEFLYMYDCRGLKGLPSGLAHCMKLRRLHFLSMDPEFYDWYTRGKKKDTWEFHYVQSITIRKN